MRKFSCFAALALLAASMPIMAEEAAVDLKLVGEYYDIDWVLEGSQIIAETDTGYALMDLDGNMLTDAVYGSSMHYICGYITAQTQENDINTSGAFAEDGSIVIPFQYADIKILSNDWAVAIAVTEAEAEEQYDYETWGSDTRWKITTADVYYLPEQKCVATLDRTAYEDAAAAGQYINIKNRDTGVVSGYDSEFNEVETDLYSVWDDAYVSDEYVAYYDSELSAYGLKDAEGNIVVEPAYDYMYEETSEYFSVEKEEKYGLIDLEGNLIVPVEYEEFDNSYYHPVDIDGKDYELEAAGYFCVIADGKMGYVREGGEVTCEPTYSADEMDNYGVSAQLTDTEGKVHIVSADGCDSVLEGYKNVNILDFTSGFFYEVTDEDYNYGMVDWHGNVIIPCAYTNVDVSGDGKYVMIQSDYDQPYQIYELEYPVELAEDEEIETESAE